MSKNYIEPEKELYAYTCPHCNTISQMEIKIRHFDKDICSVVKGVKDCQNQ
jgi:hypothetical protein